MYIKFHVLTSRVPKFGVDKINTNRTGLGYIDYGEPGRSLRLAIHSLLFCCILGSVTRHFKSCRNEHRMMYVSIHV